MALKVGDLPNSWKKGYKSGSRKRTDLSRESGLMSYPLKKQLTVFLLIVCRRTLKQSLRIFGRLAGYFGTIYLPEIRHSLSN